MGHRATKEASPAAAQGIGIGGGGGRAAPRHATPIQGRAPSCSPWPASAAARRSAGRSRWLRTPCPPWPLQAQGRSRKRLAAAAAAGSGSGGGSRRAQRARCGDQRGPLDIDRRPEAAGRLAELPASGTRVCPIGRLAQRTDGRAIVLEDALRSIGIEAESGRGAGRAGEQGDRRSVAHHRCEPLAGRHTPSECCPDAVDCCCGSLEVWASECIRSARLRASADGLRTGGRMWVAAMSSGRWWVPVSCTCCRPPRTQGKCERKSSPFAPQCT